MKYLRGRKVNQLDVADDFHEAYQRCFTGDREERIVAIPAFMNGFFACELYFKILTDNTVKGHDLHLLFSSLCDKEKRILENQYTKISVGDLSFDDFLRKVSNGFEFWRYIYENNNKPFEKHHPFLYSEKFLPTFLPLLKVMASEHVSTKK